MAYILRDGSNNIILDASSNSSIFFKTNNTNRLRITDASSIFLNSLDLSGNNLVNVNRINFLSDKIKIGNDAGFISQSNNAIAIGNNAGYSSQNLSSIAIGYDAGRVTQSNYSIAMGFESGYYTQGQYNVAIGYNAGKGTITRGQYDYSIAIGYLAHATMNASTGGASVAIGYQAGYDGQLAYNVGIGYRAGASAQGNNAVAIGRDAGRFGQLDYAVAIGAFAGPTNQHANSIVINASSNNLNTQGTSRCYIDPIRNTTSTNFLYYDTTNKEITYNGAAVGGAYNGYLQGSWVGTQVAFSVPVAGLYTFRLGCSAYSGGANTLTVLFRVDTIPQIFLQSYTNEGGSHKTLVPGVVKVNLTAGNHTFSFENFGGVTASDINDYASVSWVYSPY